MFIEYKQTKIYYVIEGDGSPVLFLHGWGGGIESFLGLQNQIRQKHTCINIDFPPFGKSEEPKVVFTLEDYVEIVLSILRKHNIKKVDIVAHSFGGRVAIFLARNTDIVAKLVLTGSAGIKPKNTFKKFFGKLRYKFFKLLVRLRIFKKEVLLSFGSEDYKKLSPKMKKTFINIVTYNQKSMLKYIQVPTLLFWGKEDNETPMYMAKIMKKKIKDSCLLVYDGCGHFCYLEKFQEFSIIVRNFLEK